MGKIMTQSSKVFFQEQRDWSTRKLNIISSYLEGFTKILGSSTNQSCVYYIDGFAGKGICDDNSKGSPVLAAELAQQYLDLNKKYKLNCINVEADKDNFQNLLNALTQYKNVTTNLSGTFSTNIPDILQVIGSCPAFFFIDPFGVKGTDWVDMAKLISRPAPTDLWLRFDYRTVRRLSGFFESGSKGADSKVQSLLKLYGVNRPDNLFSRLDGKTPEERIDNAVNYYVERLAVEFKKRGKSGFSAAFPIVSLEGQNKYYLVFSAAHSKAAFLANDTVYSVERNRPHEIAEYQLKKTGQPSLFSFEPNEQEISQFIAEQLANDIWKLFKGKNADRREIFFKILTIDNSKWFGKFASSHLTRAINLLETEKYPRMKFRDGPISKEETIFQFRN
jgi:three-Cys-motif partner protein